MNKYTLAAQDAELAYERRMLEIALEFRQEVIIPMCKRHGLVEFSVAQAMGSPLHVSFIAPNGVMYGKSHVSNSIGRYAGRGVESIKSRSLYNDLESIYKVIEESNMIEYLASCTIKLEREGVR